ncbi:MAG TPA: helix-turn-helix domain-containing protein [Planctomycetota bacterium]|nr:helix-turn-helix domain-containing protein [Planctomycetota bacterium]
MEISKVDAGDATRRDWLVPRQDDEHNGEMVMDNFNQAGAIPFAMNLDNFPCSRVLVMFDDEREWRTGPVVVQRQDQLELHRHPGELSPTMNDLSPVLDALADSIQKFVEQAVQRPPPMAVDIVEAARLLGVCDDTIRREVDRGELKASRVGRVWRIRVSELDAYLKRCETRQ